MNSIDGRTLRTIWLSLLLIVAWTGQAAAQVPSDSIDVWTLQLQSGTLVERMDAAGKLRAVHESELTAAARQALVDELVRVNEFLLRNEPLPGAADLTGEDVGEYYLDLVAAVARLRTREADLALVPAVGVSLGTARRAARLGDEGVVLLAELVERGYETASATEALGLAWFWADSTGAPLSEASRNTIVRTLTRAGASDTFGVMVGAASALEYMNDPAFLPLARYMAERAEAERLLALGVLRTTTLPALEEAAASATPLELTEGSVRATAVVCGDATAGPRLGACRALENDYENALRHLRAGRAGPARRVFQAIIQRADAALEAAAITDGEHALIAGGARQVLDRL